MAKQNPAERNSIESQLRVHITDLQSAQREHERACHELALHDTAERQHAVATHEAEIAGHELAITRLQAAQRRQQNQDVQEDDAAKQAHIAALIHQHAALEQKAKQLPVAVVDLIAEVGPKWIEALNVLSERNAIAREIVRVAGGRNAVKFYDNITDSTSHSAFGLAVGSALSTSGLGTSGPSLGHFASITSTTSAFTASDLERTLANMFARQTEAIANACAAAAQPAATTQEH